MSRVRLRAAAGAALIAIAAFGALAISGSAAAQTVGPNTEAQKCLRCHGNENLGLVDVDGVQKSLFVDGSVYGTSLHGLLDCTSCHLGYRAHRHTAAESANWIRTAKLTACGNCHADQFTMYSGSFHGHLVLDQASTNAPLCADCHDAHNVVNVRSPAFRAGIIDLCGRCHGGRSSTYLDSYHGKAALLGDASTAVCTDCHGAHRILPASDPASTISSNNIVHTCAVCHPGANRNFTGYLVHVNPRSPHSNFWVFLFYLAYVSLIACIFTFGGIHTGMYIYRGFKDGLYKRAGH